LDLPPARFDGIFANASLFHVPAQELPRVLREFHATLRPRGVLFASNPRGPDTEGWQGERYGAWHDFATCRRYVTAPGFVESRPLLPPAGTAARPATVARDRLAEDVSHGTEAGSPAARVRHRHGPHIPQRERIGPLTVDNHHSGNVIRAAKEAECHD